MHISALNDDCLLRIFCRLSLNDQLSVASVCPRWNVLAHGLASCHKSLKLFGSLSSWKQFSGGNGYLHHVKSLLPSSCTDTLVMPSLDLFASRVLMDKYGSRLQCLYLHGCDLSTSTLQFILSEIGGRVQCLSLVDCHQVDYGKVWPYLDAMPGLRHLALSIECHSVGCKQALSRLHSFHLNCHNQAYLLACLHRLPGGTVQQLSIFEYGCALSQFNLWNKFSASLTRLSIKLAPVYSRLEERRLLLSLCTRLPSLVYLDIGTEFGVFTRRCLICLF